MNQIIDKGDQSDSVQKKHLREENVVYKKQQQRLTFLLDLESKQFLAFLSVFEGKKTIFLVVEFERRKEYFPSKRDLPLVSCRVEWVIIKQMMLVGSLIFKLVLCVTNDLSLKGLNSSVIIFFFTDLNDNFK